MQHNGWHDKATAEMANWIACSSFQLLIHETGEQCIALAVSEGCEERDEIVEALSRFLSKRLPAILGSRLHGLRAECMEDPDSFVFPLATLGLAQVDWQQIGRHWAEVVCPLGDDDLGDDEQPGTFAG